LILDNNIVIPNLFQNLNSIFPTR